MDVNNSSELNVTFSYTSSSLIDDDEEFEYRFLHYLWDIVTPVLFCTIMLIGSIGNILVIYVILKERKMKTLTNILLLNLAFADILFLWVCLPFQAYKFATFHFPAGDLVCKLIQFVLYVTVYVTVWTLVAISVLRYLSVVKAKYVTRITNKRNVVITCIVIWTAISLANIPILLSHKVVYRIEISYCGMDQTNTGGVLLSFFICAYIFPLTVIIILYLLLVRHLQRKRVRNRSSSRCSSGSSNSRRARKEGLGHKRSLRAIKMLLVVVVVFAFSWLPFHVHNLISYYSSVPSSLYYEVWRIVWYCMAYGNSLANPVIYSFASEDFKEAFIRSFKSCGCCGKMLHALRIGTLTRRSLRSTTSGMNSSNNGGVSKL